MTLAEHVSAGRSRMSGAGIGEGEAAVDAEVLARRLLGWDRAQYLANAREEAPAWFGELYRRWTDRRAGREPVSIIVGGREFWGLEFEVSRDVLTPRPETELVVEEARICAAERGPNHGGPTVIVDVGTGSGCLAVSLAREVPGARIVATDISRAALEVARRNARRHGVTGRVAFVHASLLEAIATPVDLVVSNPPYVPTGEMRGLPPEVRDFEPAVALAGGTDGLDVVRELTRQARRALAPGGWLVCEFGHGQEHGVRAAIGAAEGLELVRVRPDLQRIPRVAVARRVP
jgi:release factor glutamine methyltransferase